MGGALAQLPKLEKAKQLLAECTRVEEAKHFHNAWGAMVATWVRDGLLEPTGRYQPMRAKGSHGRETKVYRVRVA